MKIRVYYEDTDGAGIVYHANYLKFAERARVELFRNSGWAPSNIDTVFAVVAINIQYRGSALIDDLLMVTADIIRIGNSSMTLQQTISRDDEILCELDITLVCIDTEKNPVPVPDVIRALV